MEEKDGKPFDPADCLMRAVADVICGITFKDGSDTTKPDLNRLLKLVANGVANADDLRFLQILIFFLWYITYPLRPTIAFSNLLLKYTTSFENC